ncbi:DUF1080 domain-containing protein [Chitinophaga horti]|uniref:DUF1080 domain-containing protein n=1 Tax=Chitinophaga horti TaxID=2920382 RepID=A0ABY6J6M8_9BACT|nr:DUF1080 domain-containing protein [Chitinophaga horti]UYQ95333.1 DUF1080 domain-containing protein [Chitinophaga horti]
MMKAFSYLLLGGSLLTGSVAMAQPKPIHLFNGKDLNDWNVKITGHNLDDNFANTFRVENGALKVSYDGYTKFDEQYGHIFHKQKFSAYLLVMEYRFTGEQVAAGPGWAWRNSGAMIHSQPANTMGKDQDFPISIEVQLLGGNGKEERTTANVCTPGTNIVLRGERDRSHCINSKSKTYAGDQWVRCEVLVLGDSLIQHIVEGDTVLSYVKPQIGDGNVSNYDPAQKQDGKALTEGYIALQSESHPVEYRKVDVYDLSSYMGNEKKLAKQLKKLKKKKK